MWLRDYFTVEELIEILEIDEVSAVEIWNGIMELDVVEVLKLPEHKRVRVNSLLR